MKGLFIPDITAEMFRNGCLESIETLMAEGEIYDIEYDLKSSKAERKKGKWVPGVTLNETGVKPIREEDTTRDGKFWSWDYYCSNCFHSAYHDTDYGVQFFDYCPYCGNKMEGNNG